MREPTRSLARPAPHSNVTASSTNAGEYFAVFSNTGGNATTSVATLAVTGLPFINGSFESLNHAAIASGAGVSLNNGDTWLTGWTVTGPMAVTLRWRALRPAALTRITGNM